MHSKENSFSFIGLIKAHDGKATENTGKAFRNKNLVRVIAVHAHFDRPFDIAFITFCTVKLRIGVIVAKIISKYFTG